MSVKLPLMINMLLSGCEQVKCVVKRLREDEI